MDIISIVGIVIALVSLYLGIVIDGGNVQSFLMVSAFIIVVGGSLGSVALSFGINQLKNFPQLFMQAFLSPKSTIPKTIDYIVMLAENARKEGLLSLEKIIVGPSEQAPEDNDKKNKKSKSTQIDPLLNRGILMVIDGMDLEQIKDALELEIYLYEEKVKSEIAPFESIGGYAPAFGMIGTIIGLIQVLANMSSPEKLASAIGVAFITTLYGVIIANVIALPIANKLKLRLKHELLEKEMIIEGICSIRNGINPKILREKLSVYLQLEGKIKKTDAKGDKKDGKKKQK